MTLRATPKQHQSLRDEDFLCWALFRHDYISLPAAVSWSVIPVSVLQVSKQRSAPVVLRNVLIGSCIWIPSPQRAALFREVMAYWEEDVPGVGLWGLQLCPTSCYHSLPLLPCPIASSMWIKRRRAIEQASSSSCHVFPDMIDSISLELSARTNPFFLKLISSEYSMWATESTCL